MKVCEVEQTLRELKGEVPRYWRAVVDVLEVFLLLGVSVIRV